jgi:hypothetical protein
VNKLSLHFSKPASNKFFNLNVKKDAAIPILIVFGLPDGQKKESFADAFRFLNARLAQW